jgi:hypothetical protein
MIRYSVIAMILLTASAACADTNVKFAAGPYVKINFGDTRYTMDLLALDSDSNLVRLKSKLEFPLDAVSAGVQFQVAGYKPGFRDWFVHGRVLRNVNDPGDKMIDSDWGDGIKFSYTESEPELSLTEIDLQGNKWVAGNDMFSLELTAGYRYQKIEQDIVGYRGWQLDQNGQTISVSGTEPGLFYRVVYNMPHVGVLPSVHPLRGLSIFLRAAYSRVFMSDYDDHLLRKKVAVADGAGNGFIGKLHLSYQPAPPADRISFDIEGEIVRIQADLSQTQRWYGDDPIDGEDNTGQVITGIPHEIESTQYNIGLRVSYRL